MKKTILILLAMTILLSACAPNAEAQIAQNANPVTGAEANAVTLQAITEFMNSAAARERAASQADSSWFFAVLMTGLFALFVIGTPVAVFLALRAMKKQEAEPAQAKIVNNFYLLPQVVISPRGRIIPLDNGARQLEAGQDVTALAERINHYQAAHK